MTASSFLLPTQIPTHTHKQWCCSQAGANSLAIMPDTAQLIRGWSLADWHWCYKKLSMAIKMVAHLVKNTLFHFNWPLPQVGMHFLKTQKAQILSWLQRNVQPNAHDNKKVRILSIYTHYMDANRTLIKTATHAQLHQLLCHIHKRGGKFPQSLFFFFLPCLAL